MSITDEVKIKLAEYSKIDSGSMTDVVKDDMEKFLQQVQPEHLLSLSDHRDYVEIVRLYRSSIWRDMERLGRNFQRELESLLSVGENGVYSNPLRFIYELIQNADDCEYVDINKCQLSIRFDDSYGKIIIKYNEKGFKPFDVYAITGIFDGEKNFTTDKIQIGEKGIGFKSVFGIADSVLVQSGLFSFELNKGTFIVPIPKYDNFNSVEGTQLTLNIPAFEVKQVYMRIVEEYQRKNVLFNNNPILFLNKLTSLKFFVDDRWRYVKFEVSGKSEEADFYCDENINISVQIADPAHDTVKNEIRCYRYTLPVTYNREACVSRYKDNIGFSQRKHRLVAILPRQDEFVSNHFRGALYSFLPTQIRLTVPLLLHVPYKLDSSREFIDPQNRNLWFETTNKWLSSFLVRVYSDLAGRVKEGILSYIPKISEHFFDFSNERMSCLRLDCFHANILSSEKLFFTTNNTFEKATDIISFKPSDNVDDPETLYLLLSPDKTLFIPKLRINMVNYGGSVMDDPYGRLFTRALTDDALTVDALKLLDSVKDFDYKKAVEELNPLSVTTKQIQEICSHDKLNKAFREAATKSIKEDTMIKIGVAPTQTLDMEALVLINDVLENENLGGKLSEYLNKIQYRYYVVEGIDDDLYFVGNNGLVLSQNTPLSSFASFAESIMGKNSLLASLQMRQESEKLNEAVKSDMKCSQFLSLLSQVRKAVYKVLGQQGYNNYIQLINNSGTDEVRFIKELLQNADDCTYAKTKDEPHFTLVIDGQSITTQYNEDGFTKANVRSITAIGESTKKQIQENNNLVIGEKGVGFKSVFMYSSEVSIHSNGFNFKLTDIQPTIPKLTDSITVSGTQMVFTLKKTLNPSLFTPDYALSLCLCLRNLRKISLAGVNIEIDDCNPSWRTVFIDGERYSFRKYIHTFMVVDEKVIETRRNTNRQRDISAEQRIVLLIPDKKQKEKIIKPRLYCGLPTKIELNVPLLIDAPFETDTSRERIMSDMWNQDIRKGIYNAIVAMLTSLKTEIRLEMLDYLERTGIFCDDWLNEFPYIETLSKEDIIPLLDGSFVSAKTNTCYVYPSVCNYLFQKKLAAIPNENIVDVTNVEYREKLILLGCKDASLDMVMLVIKNAVDNGIMTTDKIFRERLYQYLQNNRTNINFNPNIVTVLRELEIVPIKPIRGKSFHFVPCVHNIYTSTEAFSTNEYYVLDENELDAEEFYSIYGIGLSQMDDSQKLRLYKDKIISLLDSQNICQTAERLLEEYKNNYRMFDNCKYELSGRNRQFKVPFMFSNGEFDKRQAFVNSNSIIFSGSVLSLFVVAIEYQDFARWLGCEDILEITSEDICYYDGKLSDDDIEDIQNNDFSNKIKIFRKLIIEEMISSVQIEKYKLEGLVHTYDDECELFEFPTYPIKNHLSLIASIQNSMLNRIRTIEKTISSREPIFQFDKYTYAKEMYTCEENRQLHFCQICKKPRQKKYIEVNQVEYEPEYAWPQMNLCLCLECSKDFVELRNNEQFRNTFIEDLLNADITQTEEPIAVRICDKPVYFTATHLAEVQAIIKRQTSLPFKLKN